MLAAVRLPSQSTELAKESLEELATLCRSAGGDVVAEMIQSMESFRPGYVFGKGKLEVLRELCEQENATLVIFDGELTPSQQEKLEDFLDVAVIDRPALILDIFARHARSREAKKQVELAQLEYLLPRLAGRWTHLERQEAAIGTRGPGETQLETDRRIVRKKIGELKKDLQKIDVDRETQRKRRGTKINFCLVGYTNAGKSSLFNRLTGEDILVANRLFATLDSTTRRVPLKGIGEYMLSDTVGFINKLPHDLVASFRSTLKEASSADMLIHIADFSAPNLEQKIRTVRQVLAEIGADNIKEMLIFNKTDLVNNPDKRQNMMAKYPGCRFVSAKTGEGLKSLHQALQDACEGMYATMEARISQDNARAMREISRVMQIYSSELRDGSIVFRGKMLKYHIGRLEREGVIFNVAR